MSGRSASVGFDGFFLDQSTTGVGTYANQLWRIFRQDGAGEPVARLLLPGGESAGVFQSDDPVVVDPPGFAQSGKPAKLWWEQRGLPTAARQAGVRLVHIPYFSAPRFARVPVIMTIHDVIPFVHPAYRSSLGMRLYTSLISQAARNTVAVVTDSECSRRDIERHLGIDRARITVVPLAVDEHYRPEHAPDADEEIRTRLGLPGPVIFNVGGLDVRKNVGVLVEAFARSLSDLDPDTRLVIAGSAHSGNQRLYPPLEPLIQKLGVGDRVVLTGRISEAEKLRLYNLANLYVFTSLYEGFGLSPLEAMACGTPIICSDRSSLPEVVGEGGILLDPTVEKVAGAISRVMNDPYFQRRLSQQGLEQARKFSWQQTADMTREVYRRVLETI